MEKPLDIYQKKLLALLKKHEGLTEAMTLREIGEHTGIGYVQGVVNKLKQLQNKGYIRKDKNGIYHVLKDPIEDMCYLPLIGFAQCGNLKQMSLSDIQVQDRIAISTKTIPLKKDEDLDRFFFTKAKGVSMEPDIHEGDIVLIKAQQESTSSDKTLLIHNDTPKIKYIREKNGQYALFSLNKDIDDFELSSKDEVEIVGVVKMIMSAH